MKSITPFVLTPAENNPWLLVVGVVGDKRNDGLRNPVQPEAFIPYTLSMRMYTQILVRAQNSPQSLLHAIGRQVSSVDADQQIYGKVDDLDQWIRNLPEWEQEHLVAWLFGAFAVLALALAATGLFSVVSFSVQRRTNEFGIRMALGAHSRDILRIVFRSIIVSVGGGLAAGILLTAGLNNLLARWAEGSSRDVLVLFCAIALLMAVAALACAAPARRASSVDPMEALRYE